MPVSRIDEVVERLVQLAGVAMPGVQVTDGPRLGYTYFDALCVGFASGPDAAAYETTWDRQDGLGHRLREAFTVRCFLTMSTGDTDDDALKRLRTAAAGHLAALDAALRATTDGPWKRAMLGGTAEWVPVIEEQGPLCNVFFEVVGVSVL